MSVGNTTVDQRIVEMRIDNEKFEAGAKKTIGILESLDRSLKGLGQENADGFDNIGKSLDKVTDRFSAMGIVGDQIMRNLTNKTMELVGQLKNMSTMLTTQQIGAGWDKYADKTSAIQTIMAATNKTIEEGRFADQAEQLEWVNEQIQKLNKFTDETSYNFLDMVGNIGKFTAAGRELEESVTAMEGIANWAAISGGRPVEASRAMYNLSQALGMGKVTQLDWKSIENANMATYEFKQQVIDVAEELGTLKKISDGIWVDMEDHEVTVESFRENLKDGWFDSDVLLTVLNRYGEFSDVLLGVSDATGKTATEILSQIKAFKESGKVADWLAPYIEELTKDEYELGLRAFQAAQEAKTFTEAIDATKDAVSTKWMTVFELLFGNYLEAKELWTNMAETFWDIFASPVDHLIDIIKGAGGFLNEDGLFGGFISGTKQAAGGTAVLEERLSAIGKTMDDFHKALNKTMGAKQVKQIVDDYGSLEEALRNGAITIDQFKKALGALDDTYDTGGPISLNRALNKAGKSMQDFEKAIEKVGDRAALDLIENFGGVEEALKRGGISADLFKKALESLGIDSENVAETVEESVQTSVASLAEMRQLALEVLRGNHGNGEERLQWYESLGLDAELMQAMAGDLKNMGYNLSDEALMAAMESYYQYNNLASRLGYATFAEYLASREQATEEYIYDMNGMADEADMIYASLFGEGVLDEYGEYISAGDLFRKSLTNLLEALDTFGTTFDEAFMRVFGGSDDYNEQIGKMSDGFFTLTAAFYSFSERVLAFSKSETFLNFATAFFSIIRLIGKALGVVFKIGKIGLSFAMKLLSPILTLVTGIFDILTTGLDVLSQSLDSLGFLELIDYIGDTLLDKIEKPIEKINKVITGVIDTFKNGFAEGGISVGLSKVKETLDMFFENSPVALTIIHALEKAFSFLANAIGTVVTVAGGLFGGAIMTVIGVFSTLVDWFGKIILWAKDSEILNAIWGSIAETFRKVGNVLKRVFGKGGYAEQGFEEGGFVGAFNAIVDSFERGLIRLVPGGEKIVSIIEALRNVFTKKSTDENGVERMVDDTEGKLLSLEETFDKHGGFFANIIRGAGGDDEAQEVVSEGVKGLVESAWQGFLNGLRNIRISDVIDALKLGVIANVLLKVSHGLNLFNDFADNISDIPLRIGQTLEDIGWTLRSLSFDFKANAVLKFAASVGVIAGAIWLLSTIPGDKLEKASSVVIAILIMLTGFAAILEKRAGKILESLRFMPILGTGLIGFAMVVSSIGTAALILALVAKYVGVAELREATFNIIAILMTIGILIVGIMRSVKNSGFDGWTIKQLGQMMKGIGAGLVGIALAVQMLMLPILAFCLVLKFARGKAGIGKFILAVVSVLAILGVITLLMRGLITAVKGFRKNTQITQVGTFLIKVAASLLVVALAMQMMVMPILILAAAQKFLKLNVNGIIGAITILGLIGALMTGILAIFAGTTANKKAAQIQAVGNMLVKLAASLLIISASLGLMAMPIIAIAKIGAKLGGKKVVGAILVLGGTIMLLAGILALINGIVMNGKSGAQSLGLGKGLMKIAGGIFLLAAAALLLTPAIILLTGAIAGFTYILGRMDDDRWLVFENGLERLGKFWKPLFKFGAALAVVGLAAMLTGAGFLTMAGAITLFAVAFIGVSFALPYLVEAFERLEKLRKSELNWSIGKLAIMITGVCLALLFLGTTLRRLSKILGGGLFEKAGEGFLSSIKKMATGMRTGVSNGFTKTIEFLKDPKNKEALLAALETMIIIGAGYVAGILPTLADVIVGGLIGLLNAVAEAVSNQAPGIVEALNNIVKALVKVAAALLGELTGLDTLGFLNEHEAVLNRIAGILEFTAAAAGIAGIIKKFRGLKTIITGAGGVVEAVGKVQTAASMTDEIMIGLSGSAEGYFSALTGSLFTVFSVIGLTALAVGALAVGFHDLAQQAKEESDAMNEGLYGDKDASIEKRADVLKEVTDKYDDTIAKEEELRSKLREAEKSGIDGAYEAAVDEYLDGAEERIKYINDVEASYEQLAHDMANTLLPDAGIFKRTELARDILFKIKEAGGDLSKLSEYQQYLELTATTTHQLSDVEQQRQEQLEARKIKTQEATVAIREETEAINEEISTFDQLKERYSNEDIRGAIQNALLNQGIDINDFIKTDGAGLDVKKIMSSLNADQFMADLKADGIDFGEGGLGGGMKEGIEKAIPEILAALGTGNTDMLSILQEFWDWHSPSGVTAQLGRDLDAGIGMGIDQNYYQAVNPLYTLMDQMMLVFTNIRDHFVGAGTQVVAGLIEGISNNVEYAYEAAKNLGTTVKNGFAESLRIESPSKVFADLARYIPLGIEQGINQESDSAISSVVVLSDALMDAIMQSMAMVSTVADDNFEFTPRITPIVDMSNVNSAASSMNGVFGENYSMSAQMTNAISKRMSDVERVASNIGSNQTINNGDNITFNIYGTEGQDPNEIADAVMLRMQNLAVRRGAAFG